MPVAVRAFSHVVLPVSDLDASLAFYGDVCGLEVAMRVEPDPTEEAGAEGGIAGGLRIAGVVAPGGVMLELVEGMPGSKQSCYTLALGVDDVRAAEREIQAAGLTPSMPPSAAVARS